MLFGTLRLHTQPCLTPKKSTTKSLRAFAAREGFEYGRVIVWATEEGNPRTLICEDCDQDGELILRLVVQKFLGTLKNPGEGPEERTVSGLRILCLDSSDPAPELATKAILLRLFSSVSSGLSSLVLAIFQSDFQCVVNPPSRSSFPRYNSRAYIPIVAATLTHLQKLPPASPPWLVHQSPSPPSPLVDAKCCISRLV